MERWHLIFVMSFTLFAVHGHSKVGKAVIKSRRTYKEATDVLPDADGLEVTLRVFSGRPNPKWMIKKDHSSYQEVESSLASGTTYQPESGPSKLWYRGFLVKKVNDGKTEEPGVLVIGSKTKSLQLLLLQTIPKNTISDATKGIVENEIKTGDVTAVDKDSAKRFAPWWEPEEWNDPKDVELNNCYNYANDNKTNTFAQPGEGGGEPLEDKFTDKDLIRSSTADGLKVVPSQKHMCAPAGDRHLVALFIYRGGDPRLPVDRDFHFFRLDNNGYWSHKPGESPATDADDRGNKIRDPRKAVYEPYEFVCFMTTDRNTVTIN